MRTAILRIIPVAVILSAAVFADGEKDNHPDNVRRIPRAGIEVPVDRESELRAGLGQLQQKIQSLSSVDDSEIQSLLPDVMIFERAIRCALDYNEFFSLKDVDKAKDLMREGLSRADQLLDGRADWVAQSGLVVRGYISRIDNTVQPYGLVIPPNYDFSHSRPTRCDIWFHGRGETLSEVNFIRDRMKNPGRYTPADTIVLHPYGRYSNAFKFAGEVDVLEALGDVQQRYKVDENRISVRGFSMGGAACWQFAVHYSDRWFAANPGAGFSETPEFLKFFQKETLNPMPWEKALWNMHDCNHYAGNLAYCPTIAYSGEKDVQKQAADIMEAALRQRGIRLRHVIGANMGHSIDDTSKQIIESAMSSLAEKGRHTSPDVIDFETHTLKYNRMHWLTVDGLIEHWKPARVIVNPSERRTPFPSEPVTFQAETLNVSAFTLDFPAGTFRVQRGTEEDVRQPVMVWIHSSEDFDSDRNGKDARQAILGEGPFSDGSARLQAHRTADGKWHSGPPRAGLRKRHDLQGPVDDAFMDSFVFVRPGKKAASDAVERWTKSELERAIVHWRRHFRGDARVVLDADVTPELMESANLVLWGDPASNSVLHRIAKQLPIQWNEDTISTGAQQFDAASHAPIMIYPNPLNPNRYVVLNSSFTYRDYAYLNNARQVPMLPDWAIVNLDTPPGNVWPGKIVAADFFDEQWQLKRKK